MQVEAIELEVIEPAAQRLLPSPAKPSRDPATTARQQSRNRRSGTNEPQQPQQRALTRVLLEPF
jgi:hypothetical protein